MKTNIIFRQLFDEKTWTYSYLVWDLETKKALLIDPVKDKVDRDLNLISELWLTLTHIFDTHIHADHITWSWLLREKTWALIVLWTWASIANPDILVWDNEIIEVWNIKVKILSTPWHTDWCTSFLVDDMVFTWDSLLIRKTWRVDFQQWSSEKMYNSIMKKIYTLPNNTKVFPWHDYDWFTMSTVLEEKIYNTRIKENTTLEEFSQIMSKVKLDYPKYIDVALPANMKLWCENMQG